VFVLIIVVLTLLIFALLPEQWGNNKSVSFLFGLFSTVIGFYFGTRADEEQGNVANGNAPATDNEANTTDSSNSTGNQANPGNVANTGGNG
jgi:hypothetical protein